MPREVAPARRRRAHRLWPRSALKLYRTGSASGSGSAFIFAGVGVQFGEMLRATGSHQIQLPQSASRNARASSSQDHRGTRERTAPDASSLSFGDNRGWSLALANKATTQAQCGNDQCQCQRNFLHRIPLLLTALCGSSATSRVFSSRSRRSAASSHQKEPNLRWTLH